MERVRVRVRVSVMVRVKGKQGLGSGTGLGIGLGLVMGKVWGEDQRKAFVSYQLSFLREAAPSSFSRSLVHNTSRREDRKGKSDLG